jgi:hypothetical protein
MMNTSMMKRSRSSVATILNGMPVLQSTSGEPFQARKHVSTEGVSIRVRFSLRFDSMTNRVQPSEGGSLRANPN